MQCRVHYALPLSASPGAEDGRETGGAMRRRRWGWRRRRWRRRRWLTRGSWRAIIRDALLGCGYRLLVWLTRRRRHRGAAATAILARRHALELFADRPLRFLRGELHKKHKNGEVWFSAWGRLFSAPCPVE